jgi:hypothetical protein
MGCYPRVQILVLAPFLGFPRIYRHFALSCKWHPRRQRGANGDFGRLWESSDLSGAQSFGDAYRGRVYVYVFRRVSVLVDNEASMVTS